MSCATGSPSFLPSRPRSPAPGTVSTGARTWNSCSASSTCFTTNASLSRAPGSGCRLKPGKQLRLRAPRRSEFSRSSFPRTRYPISAESLRRSWKSSSSGLPHNRGVDAIQIFGRVVFYLDTTLFLALFDDPDSGGQNPFHFLDGRLDVGVLADFVDVLGLAVLHHLLSE